jgi:ABC-2 type transport system ATP-binding protein
MHAALAGIDKREIRKLSLNAIERAGIAEYANTPISKLSKGLTQRVGIAQAIVGDPKLLILDEPTSGLDPISRRHVRDLFIELRNEGKTIFLSSHMLSEIENVCDIVGMLKGGDLVACGAPDKVTDSKEQIHVQTIPIDSNTCDRLKFLDVVVELHDDSTTLVIDPKNVYEIMRAMEEMRLPLIRIETARESLEEAFLRLAA